MWVWCIGIFDDLWLVIRVRRGKCYQIYQKIDKKDSIMLGEAPRFRLKRGAFFKVTKNYSVFCFIYDRKCANV